MIAKRENGQAMVLTVLFLAGLLGMAALVLDVGSWYREKRQLQLTADASALAGAQALPGSPSSATALAIQYAQTNGRPVATNDIAITSDLSSNDSIAVQAKSNAPGFFSKLFGVNSVKVGASATARAALAAQALYVAPMVVSKYHPLLAGAGCPCYRQDTTLPFDPMGAPGAFGMLNLEGDNGTIGSSDEANWILHGFDRYLSLGQYQSDPGAKFSSGGNILDALGDRIGTVMLFPVFDTLNGTGQNAQYNIIGWVGFHLDSYDVHGNTATLTGYFTHYIAKGIQATSGTTQPDFGVRVIQLIQ
ncbi:MAG: pilus assembly protein TadG-related protein [Gaiellaceae bacterium]